MKNELYRSEQALDIDIGDMTVSVFAVRQSHEQGLERYSDSHFHTTYEFQYAIAESFTIADESTTHRVSTDEFAIIPPHTFHCNMTEESFSRSTLRFSITSNGKDSGDFSEYCFYSRILKSVKGIIVMKSDIVSQDVKRLIREYNTGKETRHKMLIYAALLITDVLQHIKKMSALNNKFDDPEKDSKLSAEDERIKFIIETCIIEHFASDDTSDSIARTLRMSKRNCARVVNRLMGENISDIVIKQRMHMAHTLITKTDRQLSDISEAVGYKTYVAFFTAFKKYYGISPVSLRE